MSLPSLPLISLSPFLEHFASHTPDAASLQPYLSKLATACQHTGFFYLTDHGIPPARLHQVLQLARTFFLSASDAEKNKLARKRPDDARGYQRLGENVTLGRRDAHEAVDFYCETPPPLRDDNDDDNNNGNNGRADGLLSGSNMWPATPTELESEMRFYVKQVLSVGAAVVRAMGMALGEEDVFVRDTADSYWVMRLIGYPPLAEGAEGISCGEHTGMFLLQLPLSLLSFVFSDCTLCIYIYICVCVC
jgi:isopenicillin N synthase-like dioxygenase